jgi:hypothetical protein
LILIKALRRQRYFLTRNKRNEVSKDGNFIHVRNKTS